MNPNKFFDNQTGELIKVAFEVTFSHNKVSETKRVIFLNRAKIVDLLNSKEELGEFIRSLWMSND